MSNTDMQYKDTRCKTLHQCPPGTPPPPIRHYSRRIMRLPPRAQMIAGESSYITSCSPLPANSLTKLPTVTSAVGVVLYVDDDKIQRRVMTKILDACNVIAIITATDGSKGLAAMQKNEFDLVISNLDMPIMDGREMIMAFRAWENANNERPRRQRVVCLTGSEVSDEALLEAGFDEVLRKPVKRNNINALLHRV